MKVCRVCGQTKPPEEFVRNSRRVDGRDSRCLECDRVYKRAKVIAKYGSAYEAGRVKRAKDPEKIKQQKHEDYLRRKDAVWIKNHTYYMENKQKVLETCRRYRIANSERKRVYDRNYAEENPDLMRKYQTAYRNRNKFNINFRIRGRLAGRMNKALRGAKKYKNTLALVGCSLEELRVHLGNQFQEDMSWENYGFYGWHVDHIKPCASFDLSDPLQQKECFHYSNLQPLWAKDNLSKGSLWNGVRMYPRREEKDN